ncbi:MAG: cyclopropane fatty acyl phospholipid synthase [Candidatus Brennerbacteria bacterium]|nr:cyclopropane fatty acyl phospholipid synthase [Candidatus Brennerbacteria bacterium]
MNYQLTVERLLARAGITINGDEPWDIRVANEGFYRRVIRKGSLGLGESYMDGWWDAPKLDEFFFRALRTNLRKEVGISFAQFVLFLRSVILNPQRHSRAFIIGKRHYDLGNDFYTAMLDQRMAYSCGYWNGAKNLDEAQEAKLDLICRKLGLQPGMNVLDIGCGWGSFVKYAAEHYNVKVLGITVSKEQAVYGANLCEGLAGSTVRYADYRTLNRQFDRIVSVGMFEHVGRKNYHTFMEVVHRNLAPDGLALLHTIGGNASVWCNDIWIDRYIFPNSMLPSVAQISRAIEGLFVMEDWHSFGADYDRTLMAWFQNFDAHWGRLQTKYGDRFYRMWKYYLLSCAGSFRARRNQLWQVVLSKKGVPGGYRSVR